MALQLPSRMKYNKTFYKALCRDPVAVLAKMSVPEIVGLVQRLQASYHSGAGEPLVPDDIYEIVRGRLAELDPRNPVLAAVGAAVSADDDRKVPLPAWMGSMDKMRDEPGQLEAFKAEHPGSYVVSEKLDGVSALVVLSPEGTRMYSRGDGEVGLDISHLVPFVSFSSSFGEKRHLGKKRVIVRGELILPRVSWTPEMAAGKANARNTVAGVVNAKVPDLAVAAEVCFVAYAVIEPLVAPGEQMLLLAKLGFRIVDHKTVPAAELTLERLSALLATRRASSEFEIDGLVVAHDCPYAPVRGRNPTWAFAFKHLLTKDTAEVLVTSVEWNVSKDGLLKPTVLFLPVHLSGVSIQRATGFNGAFVRDNRIGPGARLVVTRSGDVIPHIVSVVAPASSGAPQMPEGAYEWTKSGVDVRTAGRTEEQEVKVLANFFEALGVRGMGPATVARLHEAGHTSVRAILDLAQAAETPGHLGKVLAEALKVVSEASCVELMHASNAFGRGFGERRLAAIASVLPEVTDPGSPAPSLERLVAVDGVSDVLAGQFVDGLARFREFAAAAGLDCRARSDAAGDKTGGPGRVPRIACSPEQAERLRGQVVAFTGFRNAEWEVLIRACGGDVSSSITARTTLVVAKDPSAKSGKLKAAAERGVRIVSAGDFGREVQ